MDQRKFLAASVTALLSLASTRASRAEVTRRPVFKQELPNINLSAWGVSALEITFPVRGNTVIPDLSSATCGQGIFALRWRVREQILRAGEMLFEAPDQIHILSASPNRSKPAKILALLFGAKGKAVSAPA